MAVVSNALSFGWGQKISINGTSIKAVSSNFTPEFSYREPETLTSGERVNITTGGRALLKKDIAGNIVVEPTYTLAETIISGTFDTVSGTTYGPAADPTAAANRLDIVQEIAGTTYTYADCYVNVLKISANESEPLVFDTAMIGLTEAEAGSVTAASDTASPMLMSEGTFTIDGDTYSPINFEAEFNRNFQVHYMQSTSVSVAGADVMSVSGTMQLTVNSATMDKIKASEGDPTAGAEATFVFTDGVSTFTIHFPHLVLDSVRPSIQGGEMTVDVPFKCFSPTTSINRFAFIFA